MSGISVGSVGAQQLVASQSTPPSNQTSTSDPSSGENPNTVAASSPSGSANNSAGQFGTNTGSGGTGNSTKASGGSTTVAGPALDGQKTVTANADAAAKPKQNITSPADVKLSEATPKSQIDAKAYEQKVEEQAARDQALAQQERARQDALVTKLAKGPASISNLLDPNGAEPSALPNEVAVPDAIPDRLPPRAGVNT